MTLLIERQNNRDRPDTRRCFNCGVEGHIARNCPEQHQRECPRENFQGEVNVIVQELDVLAAEKRKHEGGAAEGQAK